jgi:hypothetical protein
MSMLLRRHKERREPVEPKVEPVEAPATVAPPQEPVEPKASKKKG